MKLAKGFRGRYFSLAAIAATVGCINLQAVENSVQSHEQRIAQTTEREIDDDVEELEDIVVESALPSPSRLKSLTSDITVITSEELRQKHYRTVLESLRGQPDLQITQNGGPGQSSGFTLRGMAKEQVVVMIDGIRLDDPTSTTGYAMLEHLALSDVKQIEIIKGAQSGVWGSDAGGGVINIVTETARKEGFSANGGLMAGNYTTHRGDLALSYGSENFDASVGFNGYKTDGFPPHVNASFDARNIERTYFAKVGVNFGDKTRLEGNYRKIVTDTEYYNPYNSDSKGLQTVDNDIYGLRLFHRWKSFDFDLYGNRVDFDRTQDSGVYEGNAVDYGFKTRFRYANGFVDAGLNYRKESLESAWNDVDMNDEADRGYFASLSHTMMKGLVFNAALRFDNYDSFEDKTTGKIGVKAALPWGKDTYMSANVGNAYRVPSMYERYYNDNFGPLLKPETSTSYDATMESYGLKATYFYNEVTDMLRFNNTTFYYENVAGKSKIQGADLAYRKAFDILPVALRVGYTYTDAKDAREKRLLNIPRHRASAGLDLYPTERLSVGIDVEYAKDYLSYPDVQMGEYIVWNAVVNYGFEEYGGVYLKVVNLFDEEYQLVDGYNTEEQSVYAGWRFSY